MADYDVAVVGGGMVGASFALALAGTSLRVVLIERFAPDSRAQPSFDERTTALGNASRRIYQALGVWDRIAPQASAIRVIHVSDAGRFGFARLDAQAQGVEAFGYVAANRVIGTALWERLAQSSAVTMRVPASVEAIEIGAERVELILRDDGGARGDGGAHGDGGVQKGGGAKDAGAQDAGAKDAGAKDAGAQKDGGAERVTARLVVAADGAESKVRLAAGIDARVKAYDQVALVANVRADRPHDATAYERFTSSGPIALLPLHDGSYTAVWARSPHDAEETLSLDDGAFLRQLQDRFGWRAGRFVRAGRRGAYPLKLSRASAAVGPRSVLIGNASQALHPVAGQGFNLGLRDAAALAEVLAETCGSDGGDPGSAAVLERFAAQRAADRRGVVGFTDGLVRLFGDSRGPIGLARNVGLLLFDLTPPAKSALARVSTGFGGRTPRLARGLPLT